MRLIRLTVLALVLIWIGWATPAYPGSGEIKDAESATHGTDAAWYSVVETFDYAAFKLIQLELSVLSHFSYLLISEGECLVIDPGRDVDTYLETAKKENAKIVGVWLSHSHADFVAGHSELSRLDIPVWINAKSGAKYEHRPLKEGDTLTVGAALVRFLETPGHTPDGMCAVVSPKAEPEQPEVLLSGDTLFIGSVGRPDLMGEGMPASSLASMMFETLTSKLAKLPDDVRVLPAHGAGSLCGAHLSDESSATIGEQRTANPYFRHKSRGEFIAAVLEGLPEAPQYFKHNAAANQSGPEPVDWKADLTTVPASEALTDTAKHFVVDIREAKEYSAGHIPNSVNIALRGRFETWIGIMVPWGSDLILTGDPKNMKEAAFRLHRVGYAPRCLPFEDWAKAGLSLRKNNMCDPRALHAAMQTPESPIVIDVRLPAEWMALRIGTVVNIPLNELGEKAGKIGLDEKVVTVCNSAYRSSMAVGVLERQGFKKVCSMAGGGEAWLDAGLPVYEAREPGAASNAPKRYVKLAERLSAAELKRMLMDVPGTFTLADVRPASQFADFHLPGAENVDIAELLDNPAWLVGVGPLVVVDRDGSIAMMLGGILSQKTERQIKVLYGGLSAYWAESTLAAPAALPGIHGSPSGPSPTPEPGRQEPKPRKRRKSAGC